MCTVLFFFFFWILKTWHYILASCLYAFCREETYLNADLFACRLYSASSVFRREEKNNNFHKKQARMLLSPLECIVVVEVSLVVLLLLNIHQMGYFTLLGIFILELFLTREIWKINDKKNFLRKLFIVTGWRHVKCYYLNAKVLLILNLYFRISSPFTQIWNKMFYI